MKVLPSNFLNTFLIICSLLVFASCEKEEVQPTPEEPLTEEEVVALVEGALVSDTEGMAKEAEDAAYVAEEYVEKNEGAGLCDTAFDTTVVRTYNGARITANYTSQWGWNVECNDLMIPQILHFNRSTEGSYETLRMRSEDSAASEWQVSSLLTGDSYIINGNYNRQGSQESRVRLQNSFSSTIVMTITDLQINKETARINSGSGSFQITGAGTGGNSFSYQGTITFLSDGSAEITINGTTYIIDLY